jgi:uncharacterized membrane protein HdeD (DUF308 family)
MTEKHQIETQTKSQVKDLFLEIIEKQKPQTTHQLIKIIQARIDLSDAELIQILLQLEDGGKLNFVGKETVMPLTYKKYIFSKKANWYWAVIISVFMITLAILFVPNDSYPLFYLRVLMGIAFIFFLPGYVFIKVLFPSKALTFTNDENMDRIEHLIQCIGASIAVVTILSLIIYFIQIKMDVISITSFLLVLIVIFATLATVQEYNKRPVKTRAKFCCQIDNFT